jgi:hypothetical protein
MSTDTSSQQPRLSSSSSFPIDTNNPSTTASSLLLQSVPNIPPQQQQVILVAVNQHPQRTVNQVNNNHDLNNSLPPINLTIPNSSSLSINSIISANRNNGHIKTQYENATTVNSLIG